MLRHHGCSLPIELWHLGPGEIPDELRAPLTELGVTPIDAHALRKAHPVRILNGWEVKAFAILHSRFREVMLLDADNMPVANPSFLFDTSEYHKNGCIFWPDFGRLAQDRAIWNLSGVAFRDEPEFESGQIVIDKLRCWRPLLLAMWMNEHSDFWYQHIHGDKETFHLAWRKLDCPYAMPKRPIEPLAGTMCQHDFNGTRLFQHRNLKKWSLNGNETVHGFRFERECLSYLDKLKPYERVLRGVPAFNARLSSGVAIGRVLYNRIGHDRRTIELLPDGRIGFGGDRMERYWGVQEHGGALVLEIYGDDGTTARLIPDPSNPFTWRGYWLIHERMPVEIKSARDAADAKAYLTLATPV